VPIEARIVANQLAGIPNLWPLERSPDGLAYCWTGADPEFRLSFRVERGRSLQLQVRLYSLIKDDYARQIRLLVDGEPIDHEVSRDGALTILQGALPVREGLDATELKIALPATHSPASLGTSPDERKLGVALNEIRVFTNVGAINRLLRRLFERAPGPTENISPIFLRALNPASVPADLPFKAMNAHLTIGNLLNEIDQEVERQKTRLRAVHH
jgi:hypothetical protein